MSIIIIMFLAAILASLLYFILFNSDIELIENLTIEFLNWTKDNNWSYIDKDKWQKDNQILTTKKLIKLFRHQELRKYVDNY